MLFYRNNYSRGLGRAEKPLICNHTYVYGVPNPHTVNVLFSFFTLLICHSFLILVMCCKQDCFWGRNYFSNSLWKPDQTNAISPHFRIICQGRQLSILAGWDKVWSRGRQCVFNNHSAGSHLVVYACVEIVSFALRVQPVWDQRGPVEIVFGGGPLTWSKPINVAFFVQVCWR